jgi:hypothetical protein
LTGASCPPVIYPYEPLAAHHFPAAAGRWGHGLNVFRAGLWGFERWQNAGHRRHPKAVDACNPGGTYLVGNIVLKPNVNLHLKTWIKVWSKS